jgi:hypothetical protein
MQECQNLFINFKLLFIMKTLNVSAYGVEEMNGQEVMQVEGEKLTMLNTNGLGQVIVWLTFLKHVTMGGGNS